MILHQAKNKFKLLIKKLSNSFGYDIKKLSKFGYDIHKLKFISENQERLKVTRELIKKYPQNPMIHCELVKCLHKMCDSSQFEAMKEFGRVRQKWLSDSGLDQLDIEFIGPEIVFGSLGNHYALENLIKANNLGLRKRKKIFLVKPKNSKFRNSALSQYFSKYINFIQEDNLGSYSNDIISLLTLPLGVCLPLENDCLHLDITANKCEKEIQKNKTNYSTFNLSDEHYSQGMDFLKKIGLPKNAWYVTVHVREPGYRGETLENSNEGFRNSNPLNYIKAIKRIIKAGGWVFRMGDPSMTPMPKIGKLIDYAHSPDKSDLLDVFLLATSKFCVGTSSGPIRIPRFFGRPVILTNSTLHTSYYSMQNHDLYLPRLIKKTSSRKNVKFEETLKEPINLYQYESQFKNFGIYWVENSVDEIDLSVKEMLENIDLYGENVEQNNLTKGQKDFKKICENNGTNYGDSVAAFSPCSKYFLDKNPDLF